MRSGHRLRRCCACPYILQIYRGLTPTMAGYFGAIHAVARTVLAIAVGPLHARWQNTAILCGPLILALGLAGLAFTLAAQPLALVALSMVLVGVGFGISNAFLNQRVMAMLIDERHHDFERRSSSACAKNALASFRISLTRRNSRISRSSSLTRRCSTVQPILPAMDLMAAHCDGTGP